MPISSGSPTVRSRAWIGLTRLQWSLAPLCRALLLAWREGAVELPVDEEVREDSTGTPWDTVRPPLDARGRFLVDEDVAANNELIPLAVVWATKAVRELTIETGLENNQRVFSGLNMTLPRRNTCWSLAARAAASCIHHSSNYALLRRKRQRIRFCRLSFELKER